MQTYHSAVIKRLQSLSVCLLHELIKMQPALQEQHLTRTLINIYKSKSIQTDLLCHICIIKQQETIIQMQKYSNIQKGFILPLKSNPQKKLYFIKSEIKQFKILAIFKSQILFQNISNLYTLSTRTKKQKYINKYISLPKISLQSAPSMESKSSILQNQNKMDIANCSKKRQQDHKIVAQKLEQQPKSKNVTVQQKKQTKILSSIKVQQKKANIMSQLTKTTSKEVKTNPVMTSYTLQRQKLQQQKRQQQKLEQQKLQMKKLLNQSQQSQQYYHNNKQVFNQIMEIEGQGQKEAGKQTDTSAKKNDNQMDIQVDLTKNNQDKKLKFIVSDDDESDEQIFQKMNAVPKKPQTSITSKKAPQPFNQVKRNNELSNQQAIKPKVEIAKTKSKDNLTKGSMNLMSWFKVKSSD